MIFKSIYIKDGLIERREEFNKSTILLHSGLNSAGKTTFIRMLLYAFGYPIPDTKGMPFERMEFLLVLEINGKEIKVERRDRYLILDDGEDRLEYFLPMDFNDYLERLTGISNVNILDNLLGSFYMDQEKGWTLLNRGKAIGDISFNIDQLVRGLAERSVIDYEKKLRDISRKLKEYKYMYNVYTYQVDNKLNELAGNIVYETVDEEVTKELTLLRLQKANLQRSLNRITEIYRRNKEFINFIDALRLSVVINDVPYVITKQNLVSYNDNKNLLNTRRKFLAMDLAKIKKHIEELEQKQKNGNRLMNSETLIDAFNEKIGEFKIDPIAVNNIIKELEKEKKLIDKHIREISRSDNPVAMFMLDTVMRYAEIFGIKIGRGEEDYSCLFTNKLAQQTGTIFHLTVFIYRLAYISAIKKYTGLVLPIVLDSPSGREVLHPTIMKMLAVLQRDFKDHQIIIASIYNFNLQDKQVIEFKNGVFGY